jgi:16S rRNA (cytosine967-C5)-methyltransferase
MPRHLSRSRAASGRPRADARAIAHEVLLRADTTDAFADVLLADRLARAGLAPADQALATRLAYGTLAWQGRLDHELALRVHEPLPRLDPPVRAALRLGLYQLRHLDRVPAYAAVDASVALARTAGRGAAGLVNAVLRRAAAEGEPALPDATADPIGRLAVEWSHPRWLVARWHAELGAEEATALLAADNRESPTVLRANPLRTSAAELAAALVAAGVGVRPAAWAPDALVVSSPRDHVARGPLEGGAARLRTLAAWRDGRFAFQSEASQLIAPLLDVRPGASVLDVCAAPGGKAVHAAARVVPGGAVLALDRSLAGTRRIVAEATRLGASAVRVAVADARRLPVAGSFDAALVDAPCSGLGTLRRHPELRWRRTPDDVPRLAALQREILAAVAPRVRPGGVLVYAVCTLAREENEAAVEAFLHAAPRFAVEPVPLPAALVTAEGFLKTLPHRHAMDGFFAARLRARA